MIGNGKKISVVTVCLNARDSIRLTMKSVAMQSCNNIEHVVIDGGSNDDTIDIVNEYPLGYFVSERDDGVYDAMEKGAKASKGDILIFLNAGDTFYDNTVCEDIASFFRDTRADIVFGNLLPVYLRTADTHDHGSFEAGKVINLGYIKNRRQLYDESIHHQATFYRRWIFNKCSFICSSIDASGEYNVLLNAIMKHKASVKYIDRPISRFVLGGISTRNFSIEWEKFLKARDILRNMYCPLRELIKTENESEFIANNSNKTGNMPKIKNKLKQIIKHSLFFRMYERLANSINLRLYNLLIPSFIDLQESQTKRLFNDLSNIIEQKIDKKLSENNKNILIEYRNCINSIERLTFEDIRLQELVKKLKINMSKLLTLNQVNDEFFSNGYSIFSQWDEDGLIQYLVSHANITNRTFVEIGVGDYSEANTRLLMEKDNWSGLVVDCNSTDIEKMRNSSFFWKYNINAVSEFVEPDNVNELLIENKIKGDIGLLSIDVDGVDYWIWDSINVISPLIVICEYNGIFGSKAKVTVPYERRFDRRKKHYSYLYAGASIRALKVLGKKKGYTYIGTNNAGNNAFFVRDDILDKSSIKPSKTFYTKPTFRDSRNPDGTLSYLNIAEGIKLINEMEVYDIEKKTFLKINDIDICY